MISVVTGSEGFIGRNLTKKLAARGHTVHCLDIAHSGTAQDEPGFCRHTVDCRDLEALAAHAALEKADYIFHLAAVTKETTLEGFRRVNVYPVRTLLQAVTQRNIGLKRFVFISSQAASRPCGDPLHPTRESHEPAPVEYYGRSKLEAERIVASYAQTVPCTIIRPSSVYGPGDRDFLKLYKMLGRGFNIFHGNRNQPISIIHVDDLTEGIIQAALSAATLNKTYFLAGPEPVTWDTIHAMIKSYHAKRAMSIDLPYSLVRMLARAGDTAARITGSPTILNSQKIKLSGAPGWICSPESAGRDFGFKAARRLNDGIKETGDWYRRQGWL